MFEFREGAATEGRPFAELKLTTTKELPRRENRKSRQMGMELLFKALADPTRLRLIHLLGDDELCVCSCVEILNTNQPKVSRHLAYLRRAGLVTARRDGKWTHYRLIQPSDSHAATIFRELRESLATNPQMQNDKARLEQTKLDVTSEQQSPDARQSAAATQ